MKGCVNRGILPNRPEHRASHRAQELRESRGGRPGLPSLTVRTVSERNATLNSDSDMAYNYSPTNFKLSSKQEIPIERLQAGSKWLFCCSQSSHDTAYVGKFCISCLFG